ncbi:MAG: YbaK/EbsC family protein [Candidatus Shapirobacteria bacterium]
MNQKFVDFLKQNNLDIKIQNFDEFTHTAAQAAEALNCTVSEIAKSLIFKSESGQPVLVIASGSNRIDTSKIASLLGESISKADADFVKTSTGYTIGGVPPFAFPQKIITFIDQDLLKFITIWAAAGTNNSVFSLTPDNLIKISQGKVSDISQS